MMMSDKDNKKIESPEIEPAKVTHEQEKQEPGKIDTAISIEGVIEGAEIAPSGEIEESEKGKKEGYAGGKAAKKTLSDISKTTKLPTLKEMRSQVEHELKGEIKQLHKKINHVMKKRGNFEPEKLNDLVAKYRHLIEILSSLARATADIVKDLWRKYVHAKKM